MSYPNSVFKLILASTSTPEEVIKLNMMGQGFHTWVSGPSMDSSRHLAFIKASTNRNKKWPQKIGYKTERDEIYTMK